MKSIKEKIFATVFALATAFSLTACAKKKDVNSAVAPLSEQIATINGTVTEMQTLDGELGEYIDGLENEVLELEAQAEENAKKIAEMEKQLACLNQGGHSFAEECTANDDGTHAKVCADCSYVQTVNCNLTWESQGNGVFTSTCSDCSADYQATVTLGEYDNIYSGEEKKPPVTVVINGETLKEGADYEVAYANNKYVGTATATVSFTGKYSGTIALEFEIIQDPATGGFDGEWITF
ncbi:MAG: hypothetical protein IJZ32_00900 [Clostridia bacterium]|nr:hypothetical protein [Clostridia bacterium]